MHGSTQSSDTDFERLEIALRVGEAGSHHPPPAKEEP